MLPACLLLTTTLLPACLLITTPLLLAVIIKAHKCAVLLTTPLLPACTLLHGMMMQYCLMPCSYNTPAACLLISSWHDEQLLPDALLLQHPCCLPAQFFTAL